MRDILTTQLYTEATLLNHKVKLQEGSLSIMRKNKGTKTISTQSLRGSTQSSFCFRLAERMALKWSQGQDCPAGALYGDIIQCYHMVAYLF